MMKPPYLIFTVLLTVVTSFVICFGLAASSFAQTSQPSDQGTTDQTLSINDSSVSVQEIDHLATQISSSTILDDSQKTDLKQRLERAKQALANVETSAAKTAEFRKQTAGDIAEKIKQAKVDLDRTESPTPESFAGLSAEQLASQIADTEIQLVAATDRAQKLVAEPTRRQSRLSEIPTRLMEANAELESIGKQQSPAAAPNESELETHARQLWLAARQRELRQTTERLEQERIYYTQSAELLQLEQRLANLTVERLRATLESAKKVQTQQQSEKAAATAKATQKLVDRVPESLKELASSNVELAELQRKLIAKAARSTKGVNEIEAAKDLVVNELATSIQRVEAVGLTDALGAMFRERRDEFQELTNRFQPNLRIREEVEIFKSESFLLEDELAKTERMLSKQETPKIDWDSDSIDWRSLTETEAKWVLLKKRRQLLSETLQSKRSMLQSLTDNDTHRRELAKAIQQYNLFVNRRLFWTRSAPFFSVEELKQFPAAVAWIASPTNWSATLNGIVRSFKIGPIRSGLVSLFAISLLIGRSRIRRYISQQGKLANRMDSTFRPTYMTVFASILTSLTWPLQFLAIGFLLTNGAEDRIAQVIGSAMSVVAIYIASRELLREICRDEGLADAHLGWSPKLRRYLRFHLYWYMLLGAVCVFLMVMLGAHPEIEVRTFGTRLTATVLFLVIGMFHHLVFRSRSPLYADLLQANPDSTICRRRKMLWAGLVLLSLSFSILAVAGYIDTVLRLGRLVQFTLLWLLTVLLALALVYRWISIRRRDVARRQALESRRKLLAAAAVAETTDSELPLTTVVDESEVTDLPALDQKTRKTAGVLAVFLALVGLVVLWKDILPAIEYFGEWELWKIGTGDSIESVSLLDLLISSLVIFGLVFAARNFISLLELVILSRTSLDSGSRYAMSMLLQYGLFIIGAVVVFRLLSIPVQQLGWLLAAASVGIGFGLQEIIANFVCGIILLLERPVRVGDVVTIGDTTGSVSKIQMRATTVTNWDRKELVIPNKDLITGKVLNWSLSNVINRMTLSVGVKYGADPDVVRDLLKNIVSNHPGILADPAPAINLESFGDSSLEFLVRFFLPSLDNRIAITHEINTAIARALAEANIDIPFPQRDVHLSIVSDQEPIRFVAESLKPEKR